MLIPWVSSLEDLEKWLKENRGPRIFNVHPKHGENGQGNWGKSRGNKVEVLECSQEEAQILLDTAVGNHQIDPRRLYNYDVKHEKYILFYYEGDTPQNQYHGFHLSEDNPEQKIPPSIMMVLKEKYEIS
ncbi:MAG: hypothetical protein HC880_15045 [Bacteroidia bacterium]|nr:hypothetical protein [Bacteroidia bacterium]